MTGGESGPQPDGLAEGIARLRRARLRRALRRGARVADPGNTLAVAQLELLTALAEHPGARPGQLARRLNMRPNTVTTIVNALSARGMLDRVTASGDRRAVELTATKAGREAVLAWQATNAAVLHLALWSICRPGSAAPWPPPSPPSTHSPARSTAWQTRRIQRRRRFRPTNPGCCVTSVTGTMAMGIRALPEESHSHVMV